MKKIVPYIPFIIITGLMMYSLYTVGTSNIIFSYEHYIALVLMLVGVISLWYNLSVNMLATFFALLLGTFSQAAFTPIITRYRFGFSVENKGLDIAIQPYCLFLMMLFFSQVSTIPVSMRKPFICAFTVSPPMSETVTSLISVGVR
ncbi:hypothetical protein ACTJJ0_28070 [Chitinophaga sp. 22321]|uniref:Uncharacterized protein n=1 Tax=Chitinophaga hostae TaxID=2831022 RepID=A0ABS5J8Y4_9BACT|nr:hypothetical protein [Chitinophaga hostae]MBS0030882.1 hypothetical protein [Chitinophaga hostae]